MRADHGFGSVVMLALLALAGLLCMATADAASVLTTRARAQAAADAAALAAAAAQWTLSGIGGTPEEVASGAAEANGATLEECRCPPRGDRAAVVVSIPTRIRMLAVAPRRVHAGAEATLDVSLVFRPPDEQDP